MRVFAARRVFDAAMPYVSTYVDYVFRFSFSTFSITVSLSTRNWSDRSCVGVSFEIYSSVYAPFYLAVRQKIT